MNLRILSPLLLAMPLASVAQTAVFTDDFTSGNDTLNGTSVPGGTPAASWTSWDIAATKAATTKPAIATGDFTMGLNSATTGGFGEAQAIFTSSPITLATTGDYLDLNVVFTATSGILVSGNTGSQLFFGLYNSGGVAPLNTLNNSGISTATGSTAATGGAQMWQGYVSRMALSGANNTIATRPQQTGAGTTSANQELGISGATGAFNNPAGAQVGSALVSTLALTQGAQYTIDYRITLSAANTLTIASSLYSGVGTGGTILNSQSATTSGTTYLTSTFDALGFGAYNKTVSADPVLDVSSVVITDSIQPVPEPTTFALGFMGVAALLLGRRSRPQ